MQKALNVVAKWAVKEGLNISPHKTAIVPFTNIRKIEGLGPLKLHGKDLKMLDEVKYLGITLDSRLNWNQHLQKIIRKTQTSFAVVRRTCGRNWGLRPNMVHWLYTSVIRPSIFYGALVWWPKVTQKTTKTQLGRIQRMACLAITGTMKSTPTAAMEMRHILRQPADLKTVTGLLSIWKNVSDPILDMQSDHIIPVYNYPKILMSLLTWIIGEKKIQYSPSIR